MDEACTPLVALIRLEKDLAWILGALRHQARLRAHTDPTLRNLPTDAVQLCEDAVQEALMRLLDWPELKQWTPNDLRKLAIFNLHLCINKARSNAYQRRELPYDTHVGSTETEHTDDPPGTMDSGDIQTPEQQYFAKQSAQEASFAPTDLRAALKAAFNGTRMTPETKKEVSMVIECCLNNRAALKIVRPSSNIIFKHRVIADDLRREEKRVKVLRDKIVEHAPHLWTWLENQGYGYVLSELPRSPRRRKSAKPRSK